MKIRCLYDELVPLKDLRKKFHDKNRNKHPEDQIRRLAKIMEYQGVRYPVKISKQSGKITSGHGRVMAAMLLKWDSFPVNYQDYDSGDQEYADVQADNAVASWSELDFSGINADIADLGPDFDIEMLGILNFKIDVNDIIPGEDPGAGIAPKDPKVVLGDVWKLGDHRLMCGDSTSIDAVEALVAGQKMDMVFTDPPYGVNFEQGANVGRDKKGKDRGFSPIANDDKKGEELKSFVQQVLLNASIVSDVCSLYVWSPSLVEGFSILSAAIDAGWRIQSQIIWNKTPFVIGRNDYHWKHEVCWYGYKGKNHKWEGGRNKTTVWDVAKTRTSDSHPTMKPVDLAVIACENSTKSGDKVLDLFGGSGSTLIACQETARACFVMEIDPKYCAVILNRWSEMTKKDPIRESDGVKWSELMS